MSCYRGFADIH
jgi:O-acetylhomoserine/O-acetylserine sulfhydrylase